MKIILFYDFKQASTKIQLIEDIFVNKILVPYGFISDGGSIPRFFWRLFSPLDGRYIKDYVLHDFIYKTGLRQRKDADKILKNNLIKNGMSKIGAYCVYFSVRLFGRKFYNKFCK